MRYYATDGGDGPPASESLQSVLADVRTAFRHRVAGPSDIGALLDLYGSITSLTARAKRIRRMATARTGADPTGGTVVLDTLSPAELHEFDGFHHELIEFGDVLNSVNFAAIDIYFPGLRDDLLEVTGRDINFDYVYSHRIAPKHGLTDRSVPRTLETLLDQYSGDSGPQNIGEKLLWEFGAVTQEELDSRFGIRPDEPSRIHLADLLRILDLLTVCRETIGSIVRENWQFRDLLQRPTDEGIRVEMSEYNITRSQVGAVGPGAHVHDATFQQTNIDTSGIDAAALAAELDQLREELARVASERDQYADLVAVSDAVADAREGKTAEALKKLSAVGKWALDVATRIGVTVATDAIKVATGLA